MADTKNIHETMPLRIQILDDDFITIAMLTRVLTGQQWEVFSAKSIGEATGQLSNFFPDIAIVDVHLQNEDGLTFVQSLRRNYPDIGIVVISAEDTDSLAQKAIASGADNFLSKPISPAALTLTVNKLAELRDERARANSLEHELERSVRDAVFPEILTNSDQMKAVLRLVEKVSPRDLSVLIFGESGTGKELVARAIHQNSTRRRGAFVELNCAALPPNLVESELFGHEKGAFTGAIASRAGKIELAHGGTLFLDEIGELPLDIQPKLLRALQERRITRVGGKKDIECDFRLVTATHRDLLNEVRANNFREDLFYRVAVFPIKLPPLRDRVVDIHLLLEQFLRQEGVRNPRVSDEARAILQTYRWPGNIRELKNFAQAVPLLSDREEIDEAAVRIYFGSRLGDTNGHRPTLGAFGSGFAAGENRSVRKLEDVEREEILHALRFFKGNVPEAAMALGMGRATLYKYIKKSGLDLANYAS